MASFFESQKRRLNRPVHVRLPTGDEVPLTLGHTGRGTWAVPVVDALRRYLVDHRAAAGDSLLIRVDDAESGRGEAWFESRLRRPEQAIVNRNREIADAAYTFMRQRRAKDAALWDLAIALLARGLYRADVAPDPLRAVLHGDRRFEFPRVGGWLSSVLRGTESFVTIRDVPSPASFAGPPDALYQLKVTLRGTRPPIWRRILVPAGTRLSALHRVLQIAMGWTDSHLHQFEVGRRVIGVPSSADWREVVDERKVRLCDVAPGAKSRLRYQYDFGDSWEHDIVVEKVLPPTAGLSAPSCIAGQRACPPEDVGGVWGYARFLEVLQDPSNDEHDDMREWIGRDFDAEALDLPAVNARLRSVR